MCDVWGTVAVPRIEGVGPMSDRKSYLSTLEFARLEHACSVVAEAFGHRPYLVGSATETPDFRDVDLRLILPDDEFDYLFGDDAPNEAWQSRNTFPGGLWGVVCLAISQYLADTSGLRIDFQIQRQADANEKFGGLPRNPMGSGLRHFAGGGDATARAALAESGNTDE